MLNLINELIEIDKNARELVSGAGEEVKRILDEADRQILDLQNEYTEHADKRLSIVNETYSRFADEKITEILKKQEQSENVLKDLMKTNRLRYEKEILERVLGKYA